MVRSKITYYKLLMLKRRAEEEACTVRHAARIAAGLPSDSPEEEAPE